MCIRDSSSTYRARPHCTYCGRRSCCPGTRFSTLLNLLRDQGTHRPCICYQHHMPTIDRPRHIQRSTKSSFRSSDPMPWFSLRSCLQLLETSHKVSRPGSSARWHIAGHCLSLIHISEPTRLGMISYAVFCLKKKKENTNNKH